VATINRKFDAVLFDLDGTLVETHIDFDAMRSAMSEIAAAAGAPEEVYQDRDILGVVYAVEDYLGPGGEAFRRSAFDLLEELEVAGCGNAKPIPHASETLSRLAQQGIRTAIVTRNCRTVASRLVDEFDLRPNLMLTRDDVPRVKPDPEHLLQAMAMLGVTPARSIMVGDHWMDVRAGIDARCGSTIGFLHTHAVSRFDDCPPNIFIAHLVELFRHLLDNNSNE
jgi:phosphoglycolate phosphatase